MATFTVWTFDTPDGASRSIAALDRAADDGLVRILDRAIVSWPPGASQPGIRHGHDSTWHGVGWGAFWGVLVGAVFLVPVLGGLAGAAVGGLGRTLQDVGISEDQLAAIRGRVTEGTSALFVLTEDGDLDRLGERFHGWNSTLVATNLTEAEREVLLETFGGGDPATRPVST